MLLRSGYIHKAPDEFSTSWKFVHLGATFKWNHLNCTKIYMSGHSKFPKTKWKYWTVPCEQCGWSNFAASQKFETMNTFLVSIPMFNRPQQEVSELFEPKWRQPLLFLHCTLYSLTGNVKSNIVKNTKIKKTHFRLSKMHFCFWQCHKNWMPHTGKCLHESVYDFLSLEQSVSFHHPWLLSLRHLQLLHHYEANGSWLWKVLRHHIPGQLVSFS